MHSLAGTAIRHRPHVDQPASQLAHSLGGEGGGGCGGGDPGGGAGGIELAEAVVDAASGADPVMTYQFAEDGQLDALDPLLARGVCTPWMKVAWAVNLTMLAFGCAQ